MDWAIEETKGNEGTDPFAEKKVEKKLAQLKQQKKEMKNYENSKKDAGTMLGEQRTKKGKKMNKDEKIKNKLNNDKKGLEKSLETIQRSTASAGKFDKRIKNEKEINNIKQKKKADPSALLSRKQERDRNNRILMGVIGKK
jgi:hypothetical protein